MATQLTKDDFLMKQALNRMQSRKDLERNGFIAIRCECGDSECRGWQLRQLGVDWPQEGLSEPITTEMMAD